MPTPNTAIRAALRAILDQHNALEEGPEGVYAACEQLTGADGSALLASLREFPEVPVHPAVDTDPTLGATRRALARAGYRLKDYEIGEG